jgi:DNA-binding response OmpR family regulator
MSTRPLKRILAIDDDSDIRTIITIALEAQGFDVAVCDSGLKAISAVQSFRPDLILLDIKMPDIDGPETLKILNADHLSRTIPVILMTDKMEEHELKEMKKFGAIEAILKPFKAIDLGDILQTTWEKHQNSVLKH